MSERVWVITGTSSGIGQAIAEYALSKGDKVVGTVRSLDKFPASLKEAGAQPVVLDLGDTDEATQEAAARAIAIYGYVDVLVNNAGSNGAVYPVEEVPLSTVREQFHEKVFGMLAFTQPFIAHFRTRRTGFIFNVSSLMSMINIPSFGTYCACKSAVESYTEALAAELAIYNVRVYILQLGYFPTNILLKHPNFVQGDMSITDIPIADGLSKIYTDQSQGYNFTNLLPRLSIARGQVGDSKVLAERVFEVVTDTGLAKEVGVKEKGWVRLPFGSGTGESLLPKVEKLLENFKAVEPIWRSTDMKNPYTESTA